MKRYLLAIAGSLLLSAPAVAATPTPADGLDQGLFWLYQGLYDKAEQSFDLYCQAHPQDPAGFFYKAATNWWELAQRLDYDLPEVETRFEHHYQQTMALAQQAAAQAADDKAKAKALLYLGGAEGMKGRWLVAKKSWVSAYFRGKSGNRYLREAIALDPGLYDAYLGLGIYDYFTDTLPGVQGVLAYLFIRGDKARGLQELQIAIDKGEHARVEAMIFLIEIYMAEEHQPEKALPLAQTLRKEFPQSAIMHLTEIMILYNLKKWPEMSQEAQVFLEKSQAEVPYYPKEGVRPARYCLGLGALYGRRDLDLAAAYFNQLLQVLDTSRWVSYAYLRRGQIFDLKGDRESALRDYRTVLSRTDLWGSHAEAQSYIKSPFSFPDHP